MERHYILGEDGRPVEEADRAAWAKWYYKEGNKVIQQTCVANGTVSTVFLGRDHNLTGVGMAVLFETKFFPINPDGEGVNLDREQACTLAGAKLHHWIMVVELGGWTKGAVG